MDDPVVLVAAVVLYKIVVGERFLALADALLFVVLLVLVGFVEFERALSKFCLPNGRTSPGSLIEVEFLSFKSGFNPSALGKIAETLSAIEPFNFAKTFSRVTVVS